MMPKEKAEEMIERYSVLQTFIENFDLKHAKECALIAVDEIQEAVRYLDDDSEYFWCEVKHELMLI